MTVWVVYDRGGLKREGVSLPLVTPAPGSFLSTDVTKANGSLYRFLGPHLISYIPTNKIQHAGNVCTYNIRA